MNVSIDFGDMDSSKRCRVLDENGNKIKFETMIQVVNYMSMRGWNLMNTYYSDNLCQYRYVMGKEIDSDDELMEGLKVDRNIKK